MLKIISINILSVFPRLDQMETFLDNLQAFEKYKKLTSKGKYEDARKCLSDNVNKRNGK